MTDLSEHNRKLEEAELQKARANFIWGVPKVPDYKVDLRAFSFAKDVNMTFFNELSDTQLMAVIEAYEIGKCKNE